MRGLPSVLLLVILAFALAACREVSVNDGRILPQDLKSFEYLKTRVRGELWKFWESDKGDKRTAKDLKKTIWSAQIDESGLIRLEFQPDFLRAPCGSSVGALKKYTMDGDRLLYAEFDFDPVQCANEVQGRLLRIDFRRIDGMAYAAVEVGAGREDWENEQISGRFEAHGGFLLR